MRSAAKGKGHDSYLRAAKQEVSQAKANAWKAALERRVKERENGTVGSKTVHDNKGRPGPLSSGSAVSARGDRIHREAS